MPSNDASARLELPYVAAGQLQKHVTINQSLTRLDALVGAAVVSRQIAQPPPDPVDGSLYILPVATIGDDWAGFAPGDLVRADAGGWIQVQAPDGLLILVLDSGELLARRDGAWSGPGAIQALDRLGIDTVADAANPFAARLNKALWTARETAAGGSGDLRVTFNKQGSAHVLSLLFQSAYGGRAEMGLLGHDDLTVKVSPDGATWHLAMAIDRSDGRARFPLGAARCESQVFDQAGTYAVPTWARLLDVVAVGGAGGGGSGAAGGGGTARFGGGGGGAGGISADRWNTIDLPTTLQIVVGAAGSGGAATGGSLGQAGLAGGVTTIWASGMVALPAVGGQGGAGGSQDAGPGGAGGRGLIVSNGGGNSAVASAGHPGRGEDRPDGSGGGGAGGGLEAAGTARNGGAGGAGASLGRVALGGAGGTAGPGGAGQSATLPARSLAGGGGGGGGANASGVGHAGGVGGAGGAGGGGGGAGSTLSGAGAAGGAGRVRITAFG